MAGRETGFRRLIGEVVGAGQIKGSPPDSVWRTLTEPFRSMTSYDRTLLAILNRGHGRTEGGVKITKLPPLSSQSPPGTAEAP
jgi:hypothetical protein